MIERILNLSISEQGNQKTICISVVYLPTNQTMNIDVMKGIVHTLECKIKGGKSIFILIFKNADFLTFVQFSGEL